MIAIFPQIATCAVAKDWEMLGVLVRSYFAGPEKFQPAPDLDELIRSVGIRTATIQMKDLGAIITEDHKGTFSATMLISNSVADPMAKRFLQAHLLGHFFAHIQPAVARGDWSVSGYRESVYPHERYSTGGAISIETEKQARLEQEADLIAAALLFPKGMVLRAHERMQSPQVVANFFHTPVYVMEARLLGLGETSVVSGVSFQQAERIMGKPNETIVDQIAMPAEELDCELQKQPDHQRKMVPRSFAVSNYGNTARRTGSGPEAPAKKQTAPKQPSASAPERAAPARTAEVANQSAAPKASARPRARVLPATDKPKGTGADDSQNSKITDKGLARIRELARKLDPTMS